LKQAQNLQCKLGAKKEIVETMLLGQLQQMRKFNKQELSEPLFIILSSCAKMYCGMKEGDATPLETFQESCRFVVDCYGMLGMNEIREAFRLAASYQFPDVDIKAYGGIFSISMLGDVLTAYKDYRSKVLYNFEVAKDKIEKNENEPSEESKSIMNTIAINSFISDIERNIELVKAGKFPKWETWERVPGVFAEKVLKAKKLNIPQELKDKIWYKAGEMAKVEVFRASRDLKHPKRGLAKIAIDLKFTGESEYFRTEKEGIYSKLLIFEYIQSHKI